MPRRKRRLPWLLAGLVAGAACAGGVWYAANIRPTPAGAPFFVRFSEPMPIGEALRELKDRGVVRDVLAMRVHGWVNGKRKAVQTGTYQVQPGMEADEVYRALGVPIRQMVRLPETNWARRSANLLERAHVASAEEYMRLFADPARYRGKFKIPLPEQGTLEGFLYPDTYDLPPLLGAEGVVERQLATFQERVMPLFGPQDDVYRTLIVASMIELEVALDPERPKVAGVIENRLRKGMRLQIDACLNYALQEWRPLTFADYRNIDSPYNTYRHAGLPPTPICSPTVASVRAALKPARHEYLYYVAMPGKYHLFATTYAEHLRNIERRKAALKAIRP